MNNRGVSEVVSYVLLIVITIAVSALVYGSLRLYVPSEIAECPSGISVLVESLSCSKDDGKLELSIYNNGLFKVDGAYIRIGNVNREFREWINKPSENGENIDVEEGEYLFSGKSSALGILPQESTEKLDFNLGKTAIVDFSKNLEYVIEVQPFILPKTNNINNLILC